MVFKVLINKNSGSVAQHGPDALSEKLQTSLGIQPVDIKFLSPEEFRGELKKIDQETPLLIGGGDGTVRAAASILKDRKIPFGILPLGTMNLFAKDLSLDADIFKLIESYKNYKIIQIDSATVNGKIFLCNAMVGIPLDIAKKREESRNVETPFTWLSLAKKGLEKLSGRRGRFMSLTYQGITEKKFIKAAVIANNEYEESGGLGTFKKKSLTDGNLSVYTVNPEGTLESLALLSKLALGLWKNAGGLEFFNTKELKLHSHKRKISVLLDGEIFNLHVPLQFVIDPSALSVLVPEIS
jgi:diacylglycerol kinase family enzyme